MYSPYAFEVVARSIVRGRITLTMPSTILLYIGVLVTSVVAGQNNVPKGPKRIPYATILVCIPLVICLVLQYLHPSLLTTFERNTFYIQQGQWWRILTALFFQDGGISGGLFNIVFFMKIGSLAEQMWNKFTWIIIYFGTGILAECVALFWQPTGAGNSIAIFGLAASILVFVLIRTNHLFTRACCVLGVILACVLLLERDIHGAAFFIGVVISFKNYIYNQRKE
jgi:membrane associated rhomboid family serine protease